MADLDATIRQLRQHPRLGVEMRSVRPGLPRVIYRSDYHIFYLIEGEEIRIVGILHARRDFRSLLLDRPIP